MKYQDFIARKAIRTQDSGLADIPPMPDCMFDYQKIVCEFNLRKGRTADFLDTGLGKTLVQLVWAERVPGKVLILAPVAVSPQTKREAKQFLGLDIHHSRDGSTNGHKITITNYERLHLFDVSEFNAVVLDESSILKSFMGKTKQQLCDVFQHTQFRLCCTATPAPNDYMELGNHSAFLGIMPANEMLSRWFINDTMNFGQYRLKGHAIKPFWEWVATWAACISKPSDVGGDDSRHNLPPLSTRLHVVDSEMEQSVDDGGWLFTSAAISATSMHKEKRKSLKERVEKAAELASGSDYAVVWCESNLESEALHKAIPDSIEVKGSDDPDDKEAKLDAFSRGEERVMVTKGSIAGFGLNWQHCNRSIHASLSYSYEMFYQMVRRLWRFGQTRPVTVDAIISNSEQAIWKTIQHKLKNHEQMKDAMRYAILDQGAKHRVKESYQPRHNGRLPSWM